MIIEEITIATFAPVLVKGVSDIVKKLFKRLVADVTPLPLKSNCIQICNGIAYGTFAFKIYNRRFARFYNKYSIPFLDFFRPNPSWRISNPRYGRINSKNCLILELDNIPRNQNVLIMVDTECKVDPSRYVRVRLDPPNVVLSSAVPECNVEIINTHDFPIFGFRPEISAEYSGECKFQVDILRQNPPGFDPLPSDFIEVKSDPIGPRKTVSWNVDISPHDSNRYRIRMIY
jgi:hypothetical protein